TDLSTTNNSKLEGLKPVNNAPAKSLEDHNDATDDTLTSVASGAAEKAPITSTVTSDNPTAAAEAVSSKVGDATKTI
ncbi:hypothetical protein ACN09X_11695, partial [Aliarcobacter butzleri]|uniref:hypothetical protein n=1 Tax=Aliarcobacter butzleri TaxID=28197 RepID=UPI003AE60726